jgi:single-strand DNA-binding protein
MTNYDRTTLIGRLVRDIEVRKTDNGTACINFTLAVNRRIKDGEVWRDEATFIDCTMFGKRAEVFAQHHRKGSTALVDGHHQTDKWTDKETGKPRSKLRVIVDNWEFADTGRPEQGAAEEPRF